MFNTSTIGRVDSIFVYGLTNSYFYKTIYRAGFIYTYLTTYADMNLGLPTIEDITSKEDKRWILRI